MTREEIGQEINAIHDNLPSTKILTLISIMQAEIDELAKAVIEMQGKVNEIVTAIAPENTAEALNDDMPEDKEEEAPVE